MNDILAQERKTLLIYGIKEATLNKFSKDQIIGIIAFAMDHIHDKGLHNLVLQLASIEMNGKLGAIYLAAQGVANVMQLKNLTPEQIGDIVEDYKFHQDDRLAAKAVRDQIIYNQQIKLELHSYKHPSFHHAISSNPYAEN